MNDEPTGKAPPPNREHAIRSVAMEMAIRSSSGSTYDEEGRSIIDPDKVVNAAKKFEAYIKGELNG